MSSTPRSSLFKAQRVVPAGPAVAEHPTLAQSRRAFLQASAGAAALGGTVVRTTRTTLDLGRVQLDFLYCTDPDGVRIELMDLPS